MKSQLSIRAFVITPLLAVLLAALVAAPIPAAAQEATPTTGDAAPMTTVDVVKAVSPAVVTVINEQQSSGAPGSEGGLVPAGSGTGFIIDDEGHIVTNAHVVAGGEQFEVVFADGASAPATLIGSDPVSDLAVIQVEGDLPAIVSLGDSSALQVGETVIAIGSPLGAFTNTVTQGIVSALGRDFPGAPTYTNLIQHDAAINPGNSGGPLFNLRGEVIGVNTLGIPTTGDGGQPVQGLFFAIPSNTVRTIVEQLIASGAVDYPFMGVGVAPINAQLAAQYDLPVDHGVVVTDLTPGGPAAAAGIEVNDIITAIDGQAIDQNASFTEVLFAHAPGDEVTVTVYRGEAEQEFQVTLGERPAAEG
ncbi:MAG: trypsin-like peptidase domain-containing protein [Thermomicrobiales bacterium]|nr:trypsin-like peptidase domain-containing protein [Thermomicrobiales bacterium]